MNKQNLWGTVLSAWLLLALEAPAQTLINIDFGVGSQSSKTGFAATGQSTNDYWNLYRHYDPKYVPGGALVTHGLLTNLKQADGSPTPVSLAVSNAPGVWGNSSGDPMYDTYLFALNRSNITMTLSNLGPGRYHFYLYGHADPDVNGEQNSLFTLRCGTNVFGPLTSLGAAGWKASMPWQERQQHVVFRDVEVPENLPVTIEAAAGINGIPVVNGLQIITRGTGAPVLTQAVPDLLPATSNLVFREIRYVGQLSPEEARFQVHLVAESTVTNEVSGLLFEGDVALLPGPLPDGWRLTSEGKIYRLFATVPGTYDLDLELLAKITRQEPWNQVAFQGPSAAIAAVTAEAGGSGMQVQLLGGIPDAATSLASLAGAGTNQVRGFIGADRLLSLRWQGKTAEVQRKSFVTVDTAATALLTPTVAKISTQLRYEILQASVGRLIIALPVSQALTRLQGDQVRDWQIKTDGNRQILTVELLKPVEKTYLLTLFSEQTVETAPTAMTLSPPEPLEIQRESGTLILSTEDTQVEIASLSSLRQVNAPAGAWAAYRFYGRPLSLTAQVRRTEPVVHTATRVAVRLEESRLLVNHAINFTVEKAGIYAAEWSLPDGFLVTEARGEGVDDWKVQNGKLRVSFASRVLGQRLVEVSLEQSFQAFPAQILLRPLRVAKATRETAEIGVAAVLGTRLKTAELVGLREIPVLRLTRRTDEQLAYAADQSDWRLAIIPEKLPPRVMAEIFNLITIGDGVVGGSATLRYGIINQGVQEFRIRVPAHWKNVEFTGANIRRKEQHTNEWIIGLQDKVWTGYTLVVTYDYQFDPQGALLNLEGAHAVEAERETGSVAITTGASLQLQPKPMVDPWRRIDETELTAADRALIARPVLLAYRYTALSPGSPDRLEVQVIRFDQLPVLAAVTDLTRLTTVLTEEGQMLTQASFMVKNNEKQYQRFQLPKGADFWSCFVNNQAAKAERDADWLLAPLPREANRDQAFAVDLVYAQKVGALGSWFPRRLELQAPRTDVPNTYAEWELYIPLNRQLARFGGNMTVARGTTYDFRDAWNRCVGFYQELFARAGTSLLALASLVVFAGLLIFAGRSRGWNGVMTFLVAGTILVILGGMLLPALSRAKAKAQRVARLTESKADQAEGQLVQPPAAANEMAARQVEDSGLINAPAAPAPGGPQQRPQVMQLVSPTGGAAGSLERPGTREALMAGGLAGPADRESPMAAGVRPVRIEIPRTGRLFSFTKVLNVGEEPLTVQARIIKSRILTGTRMIGQVAAFLLGLLLWWQPLRSASRTSLKATLGLALVIGAVAHWLATWRLLHWGLIVALPVVLLIVAIAVLRHYWLRRAPAPPPNSDPGSSGGLRPSAGAAPAVTALLLSAWAAVHAESAEAVRSVDADPIPATGLHRPAWFEPITNAVSLLSAQYTGVVRERVAEMEAVIRVRSIKPDQEFKLFGDEVAIEQFACTNRDVRLVREGRAIHLRLAEAGEAVLRLKLAVKLGGSAGQRQLEFGIPSALASRLTLLLDEPEAEVDFPTAVALKRMVENQRTRVEAVLGAGQRVDLRWTPRMKRAAEIAATVFCQNVSVVSLGRGALNVRSTFDYQISQGELRQLRVRLPEGHRLLRVEGEWIRNWELQEVNRQGIVSVDLVKGLAPAYRLVVETEAALPPLPASVTVRLPHALEVKRETGLVALSGSEELGITAEGKELQRLDADEFARAAGSKPDHLASVFRFLQPDFELTARVETIQSQIEAVVLNTLVLGFEQVQLNARVDYTLKRAGVFALQLSLPPQYRVEKVATDKMLQWIERTESNRRILEVTLKERTVGACTLDVELTLPLTQVPALLEVPGLWPLGTEKLTTFIAVSAEPGLAVKTSSLEGLTEIPAVSLPDLHRRTDAAGSPERPAQQGRAQPQPPAQSQGQAFSPSAVVPAVAPGVLAYRHLAQGSTPAATWKLVVGTELVEPWVRAEIANTFNITETLILGRARVRYEIANAPVKELRLRTPAGLNNVEISGANLRRRDQTGSTWRVELQNKVRGFYELQVTWDQPRNATNLAAQLAGLEAVNVERETGFIAVAARAPLQVLEASATNLVKVDVGELPEWTGRPDPATVLVYRYLRPGYRLGLDIKHFTEAEVLQALVDQVKFTTVVADDGQMMTEVSLSIRNHGQQFLEIELPSQTRVWSTFVAGQPVRPNRRDGKLLVPLERSGTDDSPVNVEIIYVDQGRFPRSHGTVALASPRFDLPLKNARWELYLPPDYRYDQFAGTMVFEGFASARPEVLRYTVSEYNEQENRKKIALQSAVQFDLSNAKKDLAAGNSQQASANYLKARLQSKSNFDANANRDFVQLETDLRRAQGSNLILAQNAFAYNNGSFQGSPVEAQIPGLTTGPQVQMAAPTDNAAAEQQWSKLQQAQEVAMARVRPLRVNLPTRGVRYAFTQVLQTEIRKPMTLQFTAVNTKTPAWGRDLGLLALGFLMLWGATAAWLNRPRS